MSKCLPNCDHRGRVGGNNTISNRNMIHNDSSGLALMRKRIQKEEKQAQRAADAFKNRKPTPRFADIQNRTRLRPPYYVLGVYDEEDEATNLKNNQLRRQRVQEPSSPIISSSPSPASARSTQSSVREEINIPSARSNLDSVRSDMDTTRLERKMKRLMEEKVKILQQIAEVDEALLNQNDSHTSAKNK